MSPRLLKSAVKSLPGVKRLVAQRDALAAERNALLAERNARIANQASYILPPHVKIGTIAGIMKSGTTWLMNLLDDHPNIFSRGEMHLLGEMPVDDPVLRRLLALAHHPPRWPTLQQILRHSDRKSVV